LGALNDDDVVFIEVLALMDKFHGAPPEGLFLQNKTIAWANGAQFISPNGTLTGREGRHRQ
jgi:hypothetical protein